MNTTTDKTKELAEQAKDKAKDVAETAKDKAKDFAEAAKDKAREFGEAAKDKAASVAGAVRDTADHAAESMGRGMETVGDKVREWGPESGVAGKATKGVANSLRRGGEYLEEKGISGAADDVLDMVRRNPIPALLIGFGVGFLLARALRS